MASGRKVRGGGNGRVRKPSLDRRCIALGRLEVCTWHMQPEVCTSSDPRSPSEYQDPNARARTLLPATLRSVSFSLDLRQPVPENPILRSTFVSAVWLDTRGFHGLSPPPPVSSVGCVPYDNSRQAHRSPEFITTFKVVARRPRHLLVLSLSCQYRLSVYRHSSRFSILWEKKDC